MTQVQNKKSSLNVNEVAAAVEANAPAFNNERMQALLAATEAGKQAPLSNSRAGGTGLRARFMNDAHDLLTINERMAMSALKVACIKLLKDSIEKGEAPELNAVVAKLEEKGKLGKEVYEAVFQSSDACGNNNHKREKEIFTRNADGTYSLKK